MSKTTRLKYAHKTTRQIDNKKEASKTENKKTYYVRIRSYKRVGKKVLYSSWSTVKKIRVWS